MPEWLPLGLLIYPIKWLVNRVHKWMRRDDSKTMIISTVVGVDEAARELRTRKWPAQPALIAALQAANIRNFEAVVGGFTKEELDQLPGTLEESDSLALAVRATQSAARDELRDLLGKIIRGELDRADSTPRSTIAIVETLTSTELKLFLRLRRVLWQDIGRNEPLLICLEHHISIPGLLNELQIMRLRELRLLDYSAIGRSFAIGEKEYITKQFGFGEKAVRVRNAKKGEGNIDVGHLDLTYDGMRIIRLYGESQHMMYEHFEAACDKWLRDGLSVTNIPSE